MGVFQKKLQFFQMEGKGLKMCLTSTTLEKHSTAIGESIMINAFFSVCNNTYAVRLLATCHHHIAMGFHTWQWWNAKLSKSSWDLDFSFAPAAWRYLMSLSLNTSDLSGLTARDQKGMLKLQHWPCQACCTHKEGKSYFQSDLLDTTIVETFPCLFIVAVKPTF